MPIGERGIPDHKLKSLIKIEEIADEYFRWQKNCIIFRKDHRKEEEIMNALVPHSPRAEKKPVKKIKINTTLFDLIEAVCEEVRAEEEALVVPTVLDLMKKSCVKLPWRS